MKMLLVAATTLEMDAFQHIKYHKEMNLIRRIHGVGQVATTHHLTKAIHEDAPDCIIQVGIAGAMSSDLNIGDVVVVSTDAMADLGVMENGTFKSIAALNLQNENEPDMAALQNPHHLLIDKTSMKKVNAITVNEISTSIERIHFYTNTYKASIESMEGAAFHYTCLMEKIPFVQLRSVSNYVGDRNKKNWNIELALKSIAKATQAFLDKF